MDAFDANVLDMHSIGAFCILWMICRYIRSKVMKKRAHITREICSFYSSSSLASMIANQEKSPRSCLTPASEPQSQIRLYRYIDFLL